MLSDQELICEFMEPRPARRRIGKGALSPGGWWIWIRANVWVPIPLTLNECHEVESRLTDAQCSHYDRELNHAMLTTKPKPKRWYTWSATAEQKIRALASVLRKEEPRP